MIAKLCLVLSALLGASGVALGAYHAHGLEKALAARHESPETVAKRLDQCEVGVRYQMYHALALLAVGLWSLSNDARGKANRFLPAATGLFLLGVAMFSGGLYLIVFFENGLHWSIVPLGGLALIGGWLALAAAGLVLCVAPSPGNSGAS